MKTMYGSIVIMVVCAVLALAAGCGIDKSKQPIPEEKEFKDVVLTLRHTQIKETSQARLRVWEDIVAKTEAENEGLTFKLEGIDEIINRDTKLKQEMVSGNPPDIFEVFGGADLKLYVKANRMLDLTPILEELELVDKFESLDEFTIDGKVYGIPYGGYSEGVFYNKKIFRQLGLDIPETWDELLQTAFVIKDAGYVPFGLAAKDAWVLGMMWNTIAERYVGIEAFNKLLTGETKWTDPGFIEGFRAYGELAELGLFTNGALGLSYADQGGQLLRGKAVMVFTGTWDTNHFTSDNSGGLRGEIGFFNFPSIPGGAGDQTSINASYSNGFGFSANLSGEQIEGVKKFIANFYSEEVQKRALLEDKLLPSMKLSDLSDMDPLMNEILTVMSRATSRWPAFDAIVQPTVTYEIGVGLQKLVGSISTPEQVAASIQEVQDKANEAQLGAASLGQASQQGME